AAESRLLASGCLGQSSGSYTQKTAMSITLESIVHAARERVKQPSDANDLRARARAHEPRGFRAALERAAERGPAVIAELKKASPSRGLIRPDFSPGVLARELESAGAAALSVLTDVDFFHGSLRNLEAASQAVRLPCLRKDFMVHPSQILESRAHRADAILLIVAALSDAELRDLRSAAASEKLDVLCEVHDEAELGRALDLGFDL